MSAKLSPGMVVYTYNPSTMEAEVGGSRVQCQHGLHRKTFYLTKQNNSNNKEKPNRPVSQFLI
jgi:hypothetical protein